MAIRVLVADDQAIIRTGLRVMLDAEPDIEVVGGGCAEPGGDRDVGVRDPPDHPPDLKPAGAVSTTDDVAAVTCRPRARDDRTDRRSRLGGACPTAPSGRAPDRGSWLLP
jgi:hypothetical protein